jgi:hypothetical protein
MVNEKFCGFQMAVGYDFMKRGAIIRSAQIDRSLIVRQRLQFGEIATPSRFKEIALLRVGL